MGTTKKEFETSGGDAMWYREAMKRSGKSTAFEHMAAAGLSRLLYHMMNGPFAIISAERADMTPQEKERAKRNLKDRLGKLELGYTDTKGAWREDTGLPGREDSVFVSGITPEQAEAIGRELGQEAVIVGERGKYGFLQTNTEEVQKPSFDFDLSHTLDIDALETQPLPELYTEVGNKRFVLRTDLEKPKVPNPQRPDITFSPEEIESRKQRYERLAPAEKFGPVVTKAYVAHQYEGNPPPQMAKFSMRGLGSPCPGFGGMIYCVPFAATFIEDLPRFFVPDSWGRPLVRKAGKAGFVPASPDVYEKTLGDLSVQHGSVDELFSSQNMGNRNFKNLDSLYVGPSGRVFLLRPHTHDETARSVLRAIHPELPAVKDKYRKGGGYTHADLSSASSITRIQCYDDGMGVTVDMDNPPNQSQLDSIRQYYMMTPMKRFVAEITSGGKVLTHLESFAELVNFVNRYDASNPAQSMPANKGLLYERALVDD